MWFVSCPRHRSFCQFARAGAVGAGAAAADGAAGGAAAAAARQLRLRVVRKSTIGTFRTTAEGFNSVRVFSTSTGAPVLE